MSWEPTPLEEKRLEKIEQLREAGIEPYPLRVERSHTSAEAIAAFEAAEAAHGAEAAEIEATLCGRIVSQRDMGKTVFSHIEDGYGRIQLFVRRDAIGEESHQIFRKLLDLGDFVQATGVLFRTRSGEVSVRVTEWKLLAKAVSPLPVVKEQEVDGEIVRHNAFSDVEERYRQRYADLAVNPDVRDVFRTRAKVISALRRYFEDHDFLEVETPILPRLLPASPGLFAAPPDPRCPAGRRRCG